MKKGLWAVCVAMIVGVWGSDQGATALAGASAFSIDARIGVSAAVALAEGHIKSVVHSLELLAVTKDARSGRWKRIQGLLTRFKEDQIPAVVFFALPDGSYYTVEKGMTDQNIEDRAYFPRVMAGNTTIGDLVVSKSTGKKVMVAAVPIRNEGRVIGALGASVHLEALSDLLTQQLQLPRDMVLYAIDGNEETTALHSVTRLIFEDPEKQGSETLSAAVKEMLSKDEGVVTYVFEGNRKKAVFKKSSLLGWRFALALTTGRVE